ncbi:MAG: ribosomal protein S18-alanine N-acetyltransferase [Clostridia bacterium]|nr:ribosomal protein S18-alanine N-acetyltransferase [Clostridia bacterium]
MIDILPFKPEDANEIAELEKLCFSSPWSESELCSSAALPYAVYYTAFIDGNIAGYAGMYTAADEGVINNIAVFPQYRRCGIASALMEKLADAGREKGLSKLSLEVRASNAAALLLYEKNGFYRVGIRRGYYAAPKEDAVLLDKDL